MKKICEYELCFDDAVSKGLCMGHYLQKRKGQELKPKRTKYERNFPESYVTKTRNQSCAVSNCSEPFFSIIWCNSHYNWNRVYGLTTEQMNKLPESCEICGKTGRLVADHDHLTGIFRGILCYGCNIVLGRMENRYIDFTKPFIDYLEV